MGFLDKFIPKEVKKVFKPVAKFSKKFIPKELRPFLPLATPFLPATGILGAMGGAGGFGKMYLSNLLTQQLADPDAEFDDLNQFAALLSGTQGGLMGTDTAKNLRGMTTKGKFAGVPDTITGGDEALKDALTNRSLLTKAKDSDTTSSVVLVLSLITLSSSFSNFVFSTNSSFLNIFIILIL